MMSQLASTSVYSQPIAADRSTNGLSLAKSCGLDGSNSQLQETRPGLTQLVSARAAGGFRISTRVDSTIGAGDVPTTTTRHGVGQGSFADGSTAPVPFPSPGSGNRRR